MREHHLPPFLREGLAYQIFRAAHSLGYEFKQMAQAHGLNRTRGMVLARLAHSPEGVTATDLRRCAGITAASMSNTLADMEREGLIARTPNPDDARSMLVHLTGQGQALMMIFPQVMADIEARAFAGFSEEERAHLKALLERVRSNLGHDGSEDLVDFQGISKEKADVG